MHFGRGVHLLEHVQVVITSRAIGAEAHRDPRGDQIRRPGEARRPLHVGLGVVGSGGSAASDEPNILVGECDDMVQDHPRAEHASPIESG